MLEILEWEEYWRLNREVNPPQAEQMVLVIPGKESLYALGVSPLFLEPRSEIFRSGVFLCLKYWNGKNTGG